MNPRAQGPGLLGRARGGAGGEGAHMAQGVELLAPAGTPDALRAAVAAGADAVYVGLGAFLSLIHI